MKKRKIYLSVLIIMSFILIITISICGFNANTIYIRGDADLNGVVGITDSSIIQQYLVSLFDFKEDEIICADVNKNGIDIMDATYIQLYLANISNEYNIGKVIDLDETDVTETTESNEIVTTIETVPSDMLWSENTGVISIEENKISVSGYGVGVKNNVVTINGGGDWTVKGSSSNAMIYVNTTSNTDNDRVKLRLSGVDFSNSKGPAICFNNCKKAMITLTEGTTNYLSDNSSYVSEFSNCKGLIYSKKTLEIKGKGKLNLNSNYKHAVVSDDDIIIENGIISINRSAGDGLHANDRILINGKDVDLYINSTGEGIQCEDKNNDSYGVNILLGNIMINSTSSCIVSEKLIDISNGKIDLVSTTDDGLNSKDIIKIKGGKVKFDVKDDAIHADNKLNVSNSPEIIIDSCEEGLESTEVIINGGKLIINSNDDGINGALTDNSSGNITVNGGYINVFAGGDGLDANGYININGGNLYVQNTNTKHFSLDSNDGIKYTSGIVLAVSPSSSKWTDLKVDAPYTFNKNCGNIAKDSVISILSDNSVISAIKSKLTGDIGIVYINSKIDYSKVTYNMDPEFIGDFDMYGVSMEGVINGGNIIVPNIITN